jgi:yeast amino acid transporter
MSLKRESQDLTEKQVNHDLPEYQLGTLADHARGRQLSVEEADRRMVAADQNALHRSLKGRHMQMIAM